jgi:hypothetical protein
MLDGYPHLGTLLDWEPLPAGPHEVAWDGNDTAGLVRLAGRPGASPRLWLYAMPDNTVIVRSRASRRRLPGPALYEPLRWDENAYPHARHDPAVCGPVRMTLEFPQDHERDEQGRVVLRGAVPVRVRLDPRDQARVLTSRYEVAVYVDLQFLFEEEDGVDPFTFRLDTTALNPGEHVLTVNVFTYDDHYGVATQSVVVAPSE